MEYTKNQTVTVDITDMSDNGEGIGKINGYTLFVKDAVIGDTVLAKFTKVKKSYAFARCERIITPSPDRIEPPCRFHRQCGGCQIQAMSYEAQLKFKESKVRNDLIRIGGFEAEYIDSVMEKIIACDDDPDSLNIRGFRYRNKAQFPVGMDRDGNIVSGFYAGRTHDIIPNTDCLLGAKENKEILEKILKWMKESDISAYDEKSGKGLIRHILVRKGFTTGELMVCLVINAEKLKNSDSLISSLKEVKGMKSISISVNKKNTNVILGESYKTIWGSDSIEDYIGNLKFKISPLSFFQVNPIQTKKLYEKALEYASLSGEEIVWDLYCGIGTISLFLAGRAKKVIGVEIVEQAIRDAKENAALNGITNAEFYVGAAEDVVSDYYSGKSDINDKDFIHPDVVVVDPPRKGCDQSLLDTILKMAPNRIVYVSCDPATLSRDLKILCASNEYKLSRVCPVDQFAQTVHVETVCLLSKGDVKSQKLRVEFSLEDMDTDGFKKGATYNAIRDWIKEKYGYRVTNLNIAQVKQKHGIIERENYNKPKSPDSKQPGCSEEKVKAIEDAMRHFQMI